MKNQTKPFYNCGQSIIVVRFFFLLFFLRKVGKISQWNVTAEQRQRRRQRRQQKQRSIGGVLSSMKYRRMQGSKGDRRMGNGWGKIKNQKKSKRKYKNNFINCKSNVIICWKLTIIS